MLARLALASLLVVGCAGLPTHRLANEGPAALLDGTLIEDGPCIEIENEFGDRWMVVWPAGYTRLGAVVYRGAFSVAGPGNRIRLGGGEYPAEQYDFLRTLMDQDIRAECHVGKFWLAVSA